MILMNISIFGFILSITYYVASQTVFYAPLKGDKCYEFCTSQECNDTASTILKNMDPEVKPCIDFYKFACGGFVKKEIIPTYASRYDMYDMTKDKINVALKVLIEAKIESNETKPFALMKRFYNSCTNTELIYAKRFEFLFEILEKLGGWPVVIGNEWNESNFNWKTSMSKFRKIGDTANYFIDYDIGIDETDSTKRIITLRRPSTLLEGRFQYYGVTNGTISGDFATMTSLAELLGADGYDALDELSDTYTFETKLYNIITSVDASADANNHKRTTIAELQAKFKDVQWKNYIDGILPSGVIVDYNDIVVVEAPSYLGELISLLSNTSTRILANYVFRKFVRSATYLSAITEDPSVKPRWEQCLDIVNEKLPLIIGAMYVREYFTDEVRNNVEKMITEIRQQLNVTLTQSSWMDEDTRKAAIEKATAMNIRVGYPDELLNDTSLEDYHANLTFTEDNYYRNMFNMSLFVLDNKFKDLRKPVIRTDWGDIQEVTMVNAYYMRRTNAVRIPAGILRDILYGKDRPEYLNYGTIGSTIAHEIQHAFDDKSSDYDKDGNIRDWWESTTKEIYRERLRCIVEQYSNYTVDEIGLKLNGTRTLGENFADNAGIKLAYDAYIKRTLSNDEEQRLQGLEKYSSRQMFWISVATKWCELVTKKSLLDQVQKEAHSIAEYRVIGVLSNMEDFANDFECSKDSNLTSLNSRMIPEKRCSIW